MKDIKHLTRAFALAIVAIVVFTVVRFITLPESWGKYGHYRADAITEEMEREPVYQGADSCQACHVKRHKEWISSKHQVVNCENCHGPAKEHIYTVQAKYGTKTIEYCPGTTTSNIGARTSAISINRTNNLCLRCHTKLAARMPQFQEIDQPQKQIDPKKHLKGKKTQLCFKCHNSHRPDLVVPQEEATPIAGTQESGAKNQGSDVKPAESKIGKAIYREKCLFCHGAKGDGKTEAAADLTPKPTDFTSSSFKQTSAQIINDTTKGKGDAMPAYGEELKPEEIQEVTKYIQGFRK